MSKTEKGAEYPFEDLSGLKKKDGRVTIIPVAEIQADPLRPEQGLENGGIIQLSFPTAIK